MRCEDADYGRCGRNLRKVWVPWGRRGGLGRKRYSRVRGRYGRGRSDRYPHKVGLSHGADRKQDRRGGAVIGQAFHWANLTVAFLLEVCALAALCYWGVRTGGGPVTKTALGLGTPLFAAVLWGLFAAPRAPVSVPLVGLGVKLIVFGSAVAALYTIGHRGLAIAFAVLVVVNSVLVRL